MKFFRAVIALVCAFFFVGCAGTAGPYQPPELTPVDLPRVQSQSRNGVTTRITIPNEADAERFFGRPLAEHDIQPIWLRIENDSDFGYWLMPIAIDPDYYSPDEVAFAAGGGMSKEDREAFARALTARAIPFFLKPHSVNEGFVYASYRRGGRFVDVRLAVDARTPGQVQSERFRFAVLLPTQGFDYELSELRRLYARRDELPDLTVSELQMELRSLPCCSTDESGTGHGDPLNVVLVGTGEDTLAALISSGWDLTEAITAESVRKMIGAAIAENEYITAPISSLYLFGRKQDVALQRGRSTISQRNHMRLWLAPFRCEGRPVWVGQVSRDIGVKVTSKSATLTTHIIDPVVDESREYLLHSLLFNEFVEAFAFGRGAGTASSDGPGFNLVGDPYVTDGMRMIVFLSRDPVPLEQSRNLSWNESTDPILEGKGEPASVPPPK